MWVSWIRRNKVTIQGSLMIPATHVYSTANLLGHKQTLRPARAGFSTIFRAQSFLPGHSSAPCPHCSPRSRQPSFRASNHKGLILPFPPQTQFSLIIYNWVQTFKSQKSLYMLTLGGLPWSSSSPFFILKHKGWFYPAWCDVLPQWWLTLPKGAPAIPSYFSKYSRGKNTSLISDRPFCYNL